MKVIGLDISRKSTGVAIGDATSAPRTMRASFKGQTLGAVGFEFHRWFRERLILEKPDLVCIEAAFVGKTDDAYTATLMLGINFSAQAVASGRGIACHTVAVQTWRKAFLGTGRPVNPKQAAIFQCNALGWPVDGNHDIAEACGVWAWAHLYHGNIKAMHRLLSQQRVMGMAAE